MKKLLLLLLLPFKLFSQCDSIVYNIPTDTTGSIPVYHALKTNNGLIGFYLGYDSAYTCVGCGLRNDTFSVACPSSPVEYGVLTQGTLTIAQKIDSAQNMHCTWIRYAWSYTEGLQYKVQQQLDSGLNVELTYNNDPVSANLDFITDTALYRARVKERLDITVPTHISFENEPMHYHQPSLDTNHIKKYINILKVASNEAHKYPGLRVSDGGITVGILYYMGWYYQTNGLTDSLNAFKSLTGLNNFTSGNPLMQVNIHKLYLDAVKIYCDDVNFHWYEPWRNAPNVSTLIPWIVKFLHDRTGLPVINTEFGTYDHDQNHFNQTMDELKQSGVWLQIYFNANGTQAVANPDYFKAYLER